MFFSIIHFSNLYSGILVWRSASSWMAKINLCPPCFPRQDFSLEPWTYQLKEVVGWTSSNYLSPPPPWRDPSMLGSGKHIATLNILIRLRVSSKHFFWAIHLDTWGHYFSHFLLPVRMPGLQSGCPCMSTLVLSYLHVPTTHLKSFFFNANFPPRQGFSICVKDP